MIAPTRRIRFPAGATDAEIRAVLEAACAETPGTIATMTVLHAPECPKRSGGACRCEPETIAYVIQGPVGA